MGINPDKKSREELEFLKAVGNRLAYHRVKLKISQSDVAKYMQDQGVTKFGKLHLFEIENGKANTSLYEAAMLCDLYGISIEDVLQDWDKYVKKRIPKYNRIDVSKLKTESELKRTVLKLDKQLEEIYNIYRQNEERDHER